jgi:L-fuculose-phosphate aldolase
MDQLTLRRAIVSAARDMNRLGINQGTSGNISVRWQDGMLITPSAMPYEAMRPEDIALMPLDSPESWSGPRKPSTEWRFHLEILRNRPETGAVVHAHPPYCTTLAILRREIPPVHYMIAAFGGPSVRCAPYATFGTAELATHALRALQDRNACLLANHGMIVAGPTLARAMWLAVELETLAKHYHLGLQVGSPVLLTEQEIDETAQRLSGYGQQESA